MLVKILGGVDVIVGLILIFLSIINISTSFLLFLGLIMLVKSGIGMLKDIGSWIDFLGGVILIISIILTIPGVISIIIGIAVLQKGLFSFI